MKKFPNRSFPFGFQDIDRSRYEKRMNDADFLILDDDECIDLYAFYDQEKHGSGLETKLSCWRGWTLAAPCNIKTSKNKKS